MNDKARDGSGDGETQIDLLWAAIAGLRADVSLALGRVERISAGRETEAQRTVEEAAEVWRARRQEEIDKLMAPRKAVGKGEELDEADRAELGDAWLSG